jgi:hypothetical protein
MIELLPPVAAFLGEPPYETMFTGIQICKLWTVVPSLGRPVV